MIETYFVNSIPNWFSDAVIDSIKTLPFLFFVFLFIEIFEHFFADKIKDFLTHSKKEGPIIGAITSSIPQCGFSVVASTLFSEGYLTKGTIIAVYLATSDEAIPVLLTYPKYLPYILPLILIKLLVAIPCGYLIDCIFKKTVLNNTFDHNEIGIEGCCRHDITNHKKRDFLIHPIKHTLSIFVFILIITVILNYLIESFDIQSLFLLKSRYLAPLISSLFGLIRNCAVSVGLCLLFIKGTITFGTMVSGLMTSSGIGLLVLFKSIKNKKEIFQILFILTVIGYITGLVIDFMV